MKKISKHLISFAIIAFLVIPVFANQALAAANFGTDQVSTGLDNSLATGDPRTIIARIINFALGFLGIIAVGLILFGGFKWMTAAGNEEKVSEAKQLLGAGVIGLIIILSAWALASFLINNMYNATMGNG